MCGGRGAPPDNSAQIRAQEQSLALQREQMEMQRQQMAAQQQQYTEQLAISKAAPPPAPSPVAMASMATLDRTTARTAASALQNPTATSVAGTDPAMQASAPVVRRGTGRRSYRTDLTGGLSIPAIGAYR